MIFYKSQTVSFANEPNNVAEYGTTFIRDAENFGRAIQRAMRLLVAERPERRHFRKASSSMAGLAGNPTAR